MSTRGADKGVREEVRQAMRRQAARDGVELLDDLLQRFILHEKTAILHSLLQWIFQKYRLTSTYNLKIIYLLLILNTSMVRLQYLYISL